MLKKSKIYIKLKEFNFLRKNIVRIKHRIFSKNIQKNGLKAISLLNVVFKEKNLEIALNYGTLLGIYRDKKLIAHDVDIDLILIHREKSFKIDYLIELQSFIENYDYRIKSVVFFPEKGLYKLKVLNCMIDVLTVNYDNDLSNYIFFSNKTIFIPDFIKFEKSTKMSFLIPSNVEEILEYHYGSNWSIPDKFAYEFREK